MPRRPKRSDALQKADPPIDLFPTADEIADRAYELFLHDRTANGDKSRCWRQAEHELLDRAAARAIRLLAPVRRT